jgi:hypothetical protein
VKNHDDNDGRKGEIDDIGDLHELFY